MSKSDCLFTLQQLLIERFTTLASGTNLSAAQTFHNLALTANNIDDGFYALIKPFYEPLTGTFLSKFRALNESIVAGGMKPSDFNTYIKLLAWSLPAA